MGLETISSLAEGEHAMTMEQRMEEGMLYDPANEEILKEQRKYLELLYDFNATRPSEGDKRESLMKQMFSNLGEGCYIEPPFHANWGGHHVSMGKGVYANFNLTLVDDGDIFIGDHVMFGPNVTIATAGHPVLPSLRIRGVQFNIPVRIGNNVWIGAGAVILPGVVVGDNTVIGAGSVVTKDIPANVIAVGNPCKVMREIGEHDKKYYYKNREVDME